MANICSCDIWIPKCPMSQSLYEEFKQWELGKKYEVFTLHDWYRLYEDIPEWHQDYPENHQKHYDLYNDLASYFALVISAEYIEDANMYHFDVESLCAYPATLDFIFAGQCKKIYFQAIELGSEIWETNDDSQQFWPYRWLYIDKDGKHNLFKKEEWCLVQKAFVDDNIDHDIMPLSYEMIRNFLKEHERNNDYRGELFKIEYV